MMDRELFNEINHDNNMAVVRYVLSFLVLISHTAALAQISLPISNYSFIAVGGFFTLSGFLLFASFQKKPSLKYYLSRRAKRILPPYFLVVIVCAITFVTISSLSWKDYYTDKGFWEYLIANLSFLNFIHPSLPGVFEGNQYTDSAVNGSLWTMKGEWICYFSVPCIYWILSKKKNLNVCLFMILIILCILISYVLYYTGEETKNDIYFTFSKQFSTIFVFFYTGCLINILYKYFLKYKWYILVIDLSIICLSGYYEIIYYTIIRPLAISVLVIWFSQVGKWGYFLRNHDDLSYDIYLFHYPIIQLCVYWSLPNKINPLLILLIVSLGSFICSLISWNLIGKRFLKRQVLHSVNRSK